MTTITTSLANVAVLGIPIMPLVKEIFFGIVGLVVVLIFHGSAINHIIMRFEARTEANLKNGQYNWVFTHFYTSFFLIAIVHICEIMLWTFFLVWLGLMTDGVQALLFAGSCYTTVGFVSDVLPVGWKSLAFFIAFTGLFSFAWTTSVMIGMTSAYKAAWSLKYKRGKRLNS